MVKILWLCLSVTFAAENLNSAGEMRRACSTGDFNLAKLDRLKATRAAEECLTQIDQSFRKCGGVNGPRESDISKILVDPGLQGVARAQAQIYTKAKQDYDSQSNRCRSERDSIKQTCGQMYETLISARRANQDEIESAQAEINNTPYASRNTVLGRMQSLKATDLDLQRQLGDTKNAEQIGLKSISDQIKCYERNSDIYEQSAEQVRQSNSFDGEKKSELIDHLESEASGQTMTYLSKKAAPEALEHSTELGVGALTEFLDPSKTARCDELNLDPLRAYDRGCRVTTLPEKPLQRSPASGFGQGEQNE